MMKVDNDLAQQKEFPLRMHEYLVEAAHGT
jgi:hypothetical protein